MTDTSASIAIRDVRDEDADALTGLIGPIWLSYPGIVQGPRASCPHHERAGGLRSFFEWGSGAQFLELWTDSRFIEAHAFCERHGFARLTEVRRLDDLSRSTEYRYRRPL